MSSGGESYYGEILNFFYLRSITVDISSIISVDSRYAKESELY